MKRHKGYITWVAVFWPIIFPIVLVTLVYPAVHRSRIRGVALRQGRIKGVELDLGMLAARFSSEMLIFHWFYKVFHRRANAEWKPSLRNAFSIILKPFLRFWSNFYQNSICFITFSACDFLHSEMLISHWFYKAYRLRENAKWKPSLGNAFPMILERFFRIFAQKELKFHLFHKVTASLFLALQKASFPLVF